MTPDLPDAPGLPGKIEMQEVHSTNIGELGILHLQRFWAGALLGDRDISPEEAHINQVVLDGLELRMVETVQYLNQQRPAFADFEKWVVQKNEGRIPAGSREKINRAVTAWLNGSRNDYPLPARFDDRVFPEDDWTCWQENGYVVLRNAVPREDCATLESAVWEHLGMRPDQPEKWLDRDRIFWLHDFRHPLLDKNRSSERIHRAFAEIWGTDELFLSVDQLSFNPPVREECKQFGPSNIHWDASIAQPMPFDVIGVLYLNDVAEDQGAFQCIPGFHRKMAAWLSTLPEGTDPRQKILNAFPPLRIAGKAGDLIIWRQELPHGSSVNRGRYPRFAQHLTMYPADRAINPVWK